MAITASGSIEIGAPAAAVFAWLTEHQFSYGQTYAEGVTAVDYLLTESEGQTHVIPT